MALIQQYLQARSGSVAVVFALSMIVLLGMTGMAVDGFQLYRARTQAQITLDNAVLASVVQSGEEGAKAVFNQFLRQAGLSPSSAVFQLVASGTGFDVKATYNGTLPASFVKVFGMDKLALNVRSEAFTPKTVNEFALKLKDAYGWFDKDIEFWVERPNGTKELLASAAYRMTDKAAFNWRGTGTFTANPSGSVTIGDVRSIWVEMKVHDWVKGTLVYSTKDAQSAHHVFIDGKQMAKGSVVTIAKLLPCDRTVGYALEDSHDGDTISWAEQDVFFDVATTCNTPSQDMARLTR